jgi:exopolysaccharide biosynthesis protein
MIVMAVEGRHPGVSDGASLLQCAQLMLSLGCVEAMNLDGGGSTCMLINGKPTIYPSDKGVERPVPAVLMVY